MTGLQRVPRALPSVVTPAVVMTDVQPLPPSQSPIAAKIAISMCSPPPPSHEYNIPNGFHHMHAAMSIVFSLK